MALKDLYDEFADQMIGREMIDEAGTEFAAVDFVYSARTDDAFLIIMEHQDGQLIGPVRWLESIAGWQIGNHMCICDAPPVCGHTE